MIIFDCTWVWFNEFLRAFQIWGMGMCYWDVCAIGKISCYFLKMCFLCRTLYQCCGTVIMVTVRCLGCRYILLNGFSCEDVFYGMYEIFSVRLGGLHYNDHETYPHICSRHVFCALLICLKSKSYSLMRANIRSIFGILEILLW